jgi:hypothetical protein
MSEIGKVKLPGTNTWLVDKADYDALAARLAEAEALLREASLGSLPDRLWTRIDAFLTSADRERGNE